MPPKNLRKTLRTTAEKNGWHSYYFDRYFGHAPSTTGQRYYIEDPDLEVYRTHVLNHIEKEIAVWKAPQDTLILT